MKFRNIPALTRLPVLGSSALPTLVWLAAFSLLFGVSPGASAMAQTAGLNAGSVSGSPGANVTLPIEFVSGPAAVSMIQFDLMFPSSITFVKSSTGTAAVAAGKSAAANAVTGGVRIIVSGMNTNAIASGVIVDIQVNISAGAPVGIIPITFAIGKIAASDPTGEIYVPLSASDGSITVLGSADKTAPVISGVSSSNLTNSGATIGWTTNEASNSQVEYGTTTSYGSSTSVNGSMVTSHSQALAGLSADTLYHYRVKSRDIAGNLATSKDFTFKTTASADTTAPIITAVSSSNVSGSGATIRWTTNKASNSQVEYGTTTGYGSSTSVSSAMVTFHSQTLTGLSAETLYHYRVKSRDTAGNVAVSNDYTFTTTTQGASPVISSLLISHVTSKSARISWYTDKPADSELEYHSTNAADSLAALRTLTTSHSLTLNQLQEGTLYHFRAKSTDAEGNQSATDELTFQTAANGDPDLALPRFSSDKKVLGSDTMIGMALANLDSKPATVTFTAVGDNGFLTTGYQIYNPMSRALDPQAQLPIIDCQIFGNALCSLNSNGWIKLERSTGKTSGFFLIFDGQLSLMDGANIPDAQLTDFAFTEIQADGYNKINIINNNLEEATVVFDLIGADGLVRSSQARTIVGSGALTTDLSDLFAANKPNATDYVRVKSSAGVEPFQIMQPKSGDIAMLEGQDITVGNTMIYSPQYVLGDDFQTSLSVINLDSVDGTVIFRFIREDGVQMGTTRTITVPAFGKLHIEDPEFFLKLDPSEMTAGYVEIVSDGIRMIGSTVFGDSNHHSFSSALALISRLHTSAIFSHVASNELFFTGLAILNPNSADAMVDIEVYAADGTLVDKKRERIGAGQRDARLLTQYFPSLEGKNQASGYMRVLSDHPIASFALFGTHNLSVLSAIPPQVVQ